MFSLHQGRFSPFNETMLEPPGEHGSRLLLVDDDPIVREAVARRLSRDGYLVKCAGSMEEALLLVRENRFEAIIADFHLPSMDGSELLHRLLSNHPAVPCVILTGDSEVNPSTLPHNCSVALKGRNFDQLSQTLRQHRKTQAVRVSG